MLLFLTTNMVAVTSRANQQYILRNSINYQPSITKLSGDKSASLLTVYLSLILVPSYFRSKCYLLSFLSIYIIIFISLIEKLSLCLGFRN